MRCQSVTSDLHRLRITRREDVQTLVAVQAELHRHRLACLGFVESREVIYRREEASESVAQNLRNLRLMIARLDHEFGVHVHDVIGEGRSEQVIAEQDVIERLGVAVVDVAVLFAYRERIDQRVEDTGAALERRQR